jgi:uncharacterized protein (DUF427 family)
LSLASSESLTSVRAELVEAGAHAHRPFDRLRANVTLEPPMKATWNGVTLAESDDTVVVEGNHYFPENSLKREYVSFSNHRTSCPWKGQAYYYSLFVNGEMNPDAVWYYPEPSEAASQIKGRVAFWKGVKVEE